MCEFSLQWLNSQLEKKTFILNAQILDKCRTITLKKIQSIEKAIIIKICNRIKYLRSRKYLNKTFDTVIY